MVCTQQHAAVRETSAGQARDDVANGPQPVVHLHSQSHADVAGPEAIGEGQSALESRRHDGAVEPFENLAGFAPRQDGSRNSGQRRRSCRIKPHRIRERWSAGSQRIAVPEPAVLRIASLKELFGPPEALRPCRAAHEAVVRRIAVDQEPCRAGLFRRVELDRAVAPPVARDGELAADIHASRRELTVVRRQTVVHIHDRRSDVARR